MNALLGNFVTKVSTWLNPAAPDNDSSVSPILPRAGDSKPVKNHTLPPHNNVDLRSSLATNALAYAARGMAQGPVLRAIIALELAKKGLDERQDESSNENPTQDPMREQAELAPPAPVQNNLQLIRRPTENLQVALRYKHASYVQVLVALNMFRYKGTAFLGLIGFDHLLRRKYARVVRHDAGSSSSSIQDTKKTILESSNVSKGSSNTSVDSMCSCEPRELPDPGEAEKDTNQVIVATPTVVVPKVQTRTRTGPRKVEYRPTMNLESITAGLDGPTYGFCKAAVSVVHSTLATTPKAPHKHYILHKGNGKTLCPVDECDASSDCGCYKKETFHTIYDPARDSNKPIYQGISQEVINHIFVNVKGPAALLLQPQYNKIKIFGQSLPMVTTVSSLKRKAYNQAAMNGNTGSGRRNSTLNKFLADARDKHLYQIDIGRFFRIDNVVIYSTTPITVAKVDFRIEHMMEQHAEMDLLDVQKYWQRYLPMVPGAERHRWDLGKVIEDVRLTNIVTRPYDLFLTRNQAKTKILESDAPYISICGFSHCAQSSEIINGKLFELGCGVDPIRFHAAVEYWDEDMQDLDPNMWTPAQIKNEFEFKPQVGYLSPERIAPWEKLKMGHDSMLLPDGNVGAELVRDIVWDYLAQRRKQPNFLVRPREAGHDPRIDIAQCNGQLWDFCPHCNFYDIDECYCPEMGFELNSNACLFCYEHQKWSIETAAASRIDRWIEDVEVARIDGKWMGMNGGMDGSLNVKLLRKAAQDMKNLPSLGLSGYPAFAPGWKQECSPSNPVPGYPPRAHTQLKIQAAVYDEDFDFRSQHAYVELRGQCGVRLRPAAGVVEFYSDQRCDFLAPSERAKERCHCEIDLTKMGLNLVLHLSQKVEDILLDFTIPELLENNYLPYNSDAKAYVRQHYREYEVVAPFAWKFEDYLGELGVRPVQAIVEWVGESDDEESHDMESDDELGEELYLSNLFEEGEG